MQISEFFESKKPNHSKAKDKKPKKIKPNMGHESPHPMQGKLVGETKNKKPELPKQNNPVAKHSRNMAGAGAHKSPKDYDRKKAKQDIKDRMSEGEERSIIADACIEKLVDEFRGEEYRFENQGELEYAIYNELESLNVEDCVDPDMEHGGQRMGDFASGGVLNVIDSSSVIDDVLSQLDTSELEEGTYVANKSDVIDSILRQIKDKAQHDDELLRSLAKIISKRADPRLHNRPDARWELEPISEDSTPEQIQAEIQRLQPIADKLEFGQDKARDITKAIKYENTTSEIMVGLSGLAEELGIDEKELDYYESRVRDAKMQLESAIYEMEEVFEEKYKEVAYKIEELEMNIDDMKYEQDR